MVDLNLQDPSGNDIQARGNSPGQLIVAPGGSAYEEAVSRGNVYVVAAQATVVTQAGLSATTPAMSIANRNASGKIVKLWFARWETLVSASTAFQAWLAQGAVNATAVTETTPSTDVVNAKTGAIGNPTGVGVSIVSTLPAAPVAVALLGGASSAAITVGLLNAAGERWFNGALWLPAGANWSIQTSTAGTIFSEFIFEVVDG